MRVLIGEPDLSVSRNLVQHLGSHHIVVDTTADGDEVTQLTRLYDYDTAVLDAALPHIRLIDALRAIRDAKVPTPIIVTALQGGIEHKVACLDNGADDYLEKPTDPRELVARIRAVARRHKGFASALIRLTNTIINLHTHEVYSDGNLIHLTQKEFMLLEVLTLNRNKTVSRDRCLAHMYGDCESPNSKIIDVFICKMRKKLSDNSAAITIVTDWGEGFRLIDRSES